MFLGPEPTDHEIFRLQSLGSPNFFIKQLGDLDGTAVGALGIL